MTSLAHTPSSLRPSHLRAYLFGAGATTALTAGALVVFLSLATFVAFKDLPLGGSSDDAGAAYLDSSTGAAPRSAAVALGAGHAAVARDPVRGSHAGAVRFGGRDLSGATRNGGRSGGGSSRAGTGGGPAGGGGSGGGPAGGGSAGPGGPGVSPPSVPSAPAPPGAPSAPTPSPSSGPVSHAVQGVDNAAGTNLSGPTSGVTGAVDGAATGALNRAGGAVGHPHLGNTAAGAVNHVTDTVLGGGSGRSGGGPSGGGLLGG